MSCQPRICGVQPTVRTQLTDMCEHIDPDLMDEGIHQRLSRSARESHLHLNCVMNQE